MCPCPTPLQTPSVTMAGANAGTAGADGTQVWDTLSEGASLLAEVAAKYLCEDLWDFTVACAGVHHPLRRILWHALCLRICTKHKHTLVDVDGAFNHGVPLPKWLTATLATAFALYATMRYQANPTLVQPQVVQGARVNLNQVALRYLRSHGVRWLSDRERVRLGVRAAEQLRDLWGRLPGEAAVLWMDNYYRRRYTTNPSHGDTSLNCTALSLLLLEPALRGVPAFPGHRGPEDLGLRCTVLGPQMRDAVGRLWGDVAHVLDQLPSGHDVRAPLDVKRDELPVFRWEPLMLSGLQVSSNADLVRLLVCLRDEVRPRLGRVLPLLVDENIHYRLLRMLWGVGGTSGGMWQGC